MVPTQYTNYAVKAASGMAHPTKAGHRVAMGYWRCSVDIIVENFMEFPLYNTHPDDVQQTLCAARGSIVQWPKRHIVLQQAQPSQIPLSVSSTPSSPLPDVLEQDNSTTKMDHEQNSTPVSPLVDSIPKEELPMLYRLNELDPSLMRCWILYMAREVKEKNKSVGFLNPDQVNGNRIELEPEEVEAWLVNEMVAQQDKEYIFLPYIQESHWILIVFIPKCGRAVWLDSYIYQGTKHNWTKVLELLNRAYKAYGCKLGGDGSSLVHNTKFLYHQQPNGTKLSGYYVMHHMQLILDLTSVVNEKDWPEIEPEELDPVFLQGLQRQLFNLGLQGEEPEQADNTKKTDRRDTDCIEMAYKSYHLHQPSDGIFYIPKDDLSMLNEPRELDASVMRCWTLYMAREAREQKILVGFLDPHQVTGERIKPSNNEADHVKAWLVQAMLAEQDKEYIFLPYNQEFHWILIVLLPKYGRAVWLDSFKDSATKHDWTDVTDLLNRAYETSNPGASGSTLVHDTSFTCHQQPTGTNLCGYYVMHHMKLIFEHTSVTNEKVLPKFDRGSLQSVVLKNLRDELHNFIIAQVLTPGGEFYKMSS